MMYNNKLVCCIKSNNQILREFGEEVLIPFGSEFSLLIKNLNSVRASVRVSIDGTDIADGTSFAIGANGELNLERYVRSGNLNQGNKFKFIERTSSIEYHRGIKAEDGLVRIEFQYEKPRAVVTPIPIWYNDPRNTWYTHTYRDPGFCGQKMGDNVFGNVVGGNTKSVTRGIQSGGVSGQSVANYSVDAQGITVPGSDSNQQFVMVSEMDLEPVKHVIVLKLKGVYSKQPVVAAVTVKAKPTCETCWRVNKATSKFCAECGTALNIL